MFFLDLQPILKGWYLLPLLVTFTGSMASGAWERGYTMISIPMHVMVYPTATQAAPLKSYRPVILMHGVLSGPVDMGLLKIRIQSAHPGTKVLDVNAYNDIPGSGTEMWTQVRGVHSKIQDFIDSATDGVNMLCYSQGGLVCRGILEQFSEPKVKTFISLSSPQAGQFGDTDFFPFFPNFTRDNLYLVAYTKAGQRISIANYWNDPHHQDLYKEYNKFLPVLTSAASATFYSNFLNLEQLILIGGPNDGVIQPWQSSHFAFYDENEKIVPMTSQDFYKNDSFGLRTLDQQGKVKVYEIPGVEHLEWPLEKTVFEKYIEPYLQ